MTKDKVLITGATGYVSGRMLEDLRARYEVVPLDVSDRNREGRKVDGVQVVDLIDPDRSQYQQYFEGVDTVIHLAHKSREGRPIDHYFVEKQNVEMAYNVLRCAYDAGVRRAIVATSNHAADWYEHNLIHARKMDVVQPYDFPLSDNFYGWAKSSQEVMGFLFASGFPSFEHPSGREILVEGVNVGRKLEVVMVRIGAPREIRVEDFPGDPQGYKRDLGAYISPRDLTQLFTRALEDPSIENEHGIPWLVVYGVSDNARAFWSLTSARKYLDYRPEDDSEVKYADDIRAFLTAPGGQAGPGRVG